jgi:hypothetical protein
MFLMVVSRHNPSLPLFAILPQVSARGLWRIVVGFSATREYLLSTLELIVYMSSGVFKKNPKHLLERRRISS